jgi:hypothetical protein
MNVTIEERLGRYAVQLDAAVNEYLDGSSRPEPEPLLPGPERLPNRRAARRLVAAGTVVCVLAGGVAAILLTRHDRTSAPSLSAGASSTATMALPPAGTSTADLRGTAIAWAHAFLVGSAADIKALQGPECTAQSATTVAAPIVSMYLRGLRAELQAHLGRPLDKIKIRGVAVRNVTATTGDAVVEYDLPAAVVGNDNWVSYAVHAGRWMVADCHAPIGGESTSASATSVAP